MMAFCLMFISSMLFQVPSVEPVPNASIPKHEAFMKCAKKCADCQLQCDSCYSHCLAMLLDGKKQHAPSIQMCNDCSEFCKTCSTLCARKSPLTRLMLESCAKSCDECASCCELGLNDPHMTACAKSCRDCAKACRNLQSEIK
jgi:hypothetical protein